MANAGCEVCGTNKERNTLDLPTYEGKRMCKRCIARAINSKKTYTNRDAEYTVALVKHCMNRGGVTWKE